MSARDSILEYLESNDSFTTEKLARITGLKRDSIAYMARKMARAGELVTTSREGNWLVYSRPITAQGMEGNTIFEECRRSPYMQRLLMMYGRREGVRL